MRALALSTPVVVTATESTSLIEVAKMMRVNGIGDVVITREDDRRAEPVGIVTDRDIVVHAIACDMDLNAITAGDLSRRTLAFVGPDADLESIVKLMGERGVRRILVIEDSELLGLISIDDVIRVMSRITFDLERLVTQQLEFEGMREVESSTAAGSDVIS